MTHPTLIQATAALKKATPFGDNVRNHINRDKIPNHEMGEDNP